MPAIGCSILGDHIETFHVLLECDQLDTSIIGVRHVNRCNECCSMVTHLYLALCPNHYFCED